LKCVLQLILPILLLFGSAASARAEAPALVFPPMTGSVVDAAQMLDSKTTMRLARLLRAHEQATGERVVVVTLVDLQGATIEEFGSQLGDAWNLGRQGRQDSALLIVDREKRKVLIEVGAALAGRLTEAQSSLIINMLINPEFEDARFSSGIERGAQAMLVALGGHVPDYPEPVSDSDVYEPQTDIRHAWQMALVLAGLVLLIVAVSVRRGAPCRAALRGERESDGDRFGGGGASGNW
jgi:uncharacterized protein